MLYYVNYSTRLFKIFSFLLLQIIILPNVVEAQKPATIKTYNKVFTTYPYRDPNPIPQQSLIYPYFRYDLFTNTPIKKSWKIVELENDYIKVLILPEIGGKIWTAIEKSTGKPFIYNNDVVKFRDVAMRGPWTSGGIEANYGIIGHTPNCATPVDYKLQYKSDGSVSCIIGVLDLLTRTSWQLDINLPKNKAYFTTTSFWYNSSNYEQPYYTWMNAAIQTKNDLEFVFPGNTYLGHEGQHHNWPVNKQNGKHINWYKDNNFGSYKSYHVFGTYSNFFGAYWHNDDFGMGRYSTRDDKPGKKIWMWGLSQQGMIWEKLLTDSAGQYAEIQSGRLFNQAEEKSTYTPFKHKGFVPHTTDVWTEYWFPAMETKGMVLANNYGVLNVTKQTNNLDLHFLPLQSLKDTLKITSNNQLIYQQPIQLNVLQIFHKIIPLADSLPYFSVSIGKYLLYNSDTQKLALSRPLNLPANFNWNDVDGLYTLGHEHLIERNYASAMQYFNTAIQKDSNYLPALVDASIVQFHNANYSLALFYATRALSINTYNPAANYYYGLCNKQINKINDAIDGFEIAALDISYRDAAYIELAKLYLQLQQYEKSIHYAQLAIRYNQQSVDAYQILIVISRIQHNQQLHQSYLQTLLSFNSLNHFAAFENYLSNPTTIQKQAFLSTIVNELPAETFLELAIWYWSVGRNNEAIQLLYMAPANTEVKIWLAYLTSTPIPNNLNPDLIAPFRNETNDIIHKLLQRNNLWILKYYCALIERNNNNISTALQLLQSCGDSVKFAPFYAVRASLYSTKDSLEIWKDLNKAHSLDPAQWRYMHSLIQYCIDRKKISTALSFAEQTFLKDTTNYLMGITYANVLILNEEYQNALNVLSSIVILPYEGSTIGRNLYRQALLKLALQSMQHQKFQQALGYIEQAKLWPENLGAGKPYDNMLDESLEDWFMYQNYKSLQNESLAQATLTKIIQNSQEQLRIAEGVVTPFRYFITLLAFEQLHENAQQFKNACKLQFNHFLNEYQLVDDYLQSNNKTLPNFQNNSVNFELWNEWKNISF